MTSTPVSNITEIVATPRVDNVQAKKADENFAGSLKKAVEKTGKDEKQNDFSSKTATEDANRDNIRENEGLDKDHPYGETKTSEARNEKTEVASSKETEQDEVDTEILETMNSALLGEQNVAVNNLPVDEETLQLVTETVDQIMTDLSDSLGVSMETIRETMEVLGLSAADLLVSENLTKVFTEIAGVEDSISLVMDENLYQSWQNLSKEAGELVDNLENALDIDPDELEQVVGLVEQMETEMTETSVGTDTMETKNPLMKASEEATPIIEVIQQNEAGEESKIVEPKEQATEKVTAEETDTVDPQTVKVTSTDNKSDAFEKQSSDKEDGSEDRLLDRSSNQSTIGSENAVSQMNPETGFDFNRVETFTERESLTTMDHSVETEEIANQILEHMKVQLKEDVTELEMQLHPASLGTVNVSLVAREGNITAQFTAQNEAVKQIMETQLVQLKEQFEEQGIKVDAVEVAVSNHQFEKQYNGEEQRESQRNSRSKVRTRRINLEELNEEDLEKLLTDDEKMQADLMQRSGNTVDFTA